MSKQFALKPSVLVALGAAAVAALAVGAASLVRGCDECLLPPAQPAPIDAPDDAPDDAPEGGGHLYFSLQVPAVYTTVARHAGPSGKDSLYMSAEMPNGTRRALEVHRERADGSYCHLGYCDAPAEGVVAAGDLKWDFLGALRYCDAGECGASSRYYRTVVGDYRYYLSFLNEPDEKKILEDLALNNW